MTTTHVVLLIGLATQQAAATWNFFGSFNTPNYNNNECNNKQKTGFDWSELQAGDKNFQYSDFDFSKGWSCSNSLGKRDSLTKRTFGSKAITNTIRKNQSASFGCDKRKSGFSVADIDVSVEFDVDLDLHYQMGDGSTCRQTSSCAASGSTIKNTQCGGATSVDIYLSSHYQGDKVECEIGLHHIGFDCDAATGYITPSLPVIISSTTEPISKLATSTLLLPSTTTGPLALSCYINNKDCGSQPPATSTSNHCPGKSCNTAVYTPSSQLSSSALAPYTNTSSAVYTPPSTYKTSQPSCLSSESSISASLIYETSNLPSQSSRVGLPVPLVSTAIPKPSSPSYNLPPVPDVLPKCLNSWLQISTKCKDNTDNDCYCVNSEFTTNVINCVAAWCGTDEETKKSLQYFIGICAEHVPENPKIIEDCPTYIALTTTPIAPTGGVKTTIMSGITPMPTTPCTTITYGTTSLTVPAVHFTTVTVSAGATPTEPIALIPGTAPPPTSATTTIAPYPTPSTLGTATEPGNTGTGVYRPSSPAEFTGVAALVEVVPKQAFLGAVLALWAL